MTMSEVEVDRITQQVFAARNSGLDAALVKVVIDEIEKATEAQAARLTQVEAVAASMLGLFAHSTHPGRPCKQSGHVPVELIDKWRAVLRGES